MEIKYAKKKWKERERMIATGRVLVRKRGNDALLSVAEIYPSY